MKRRNFLSLIGGAAAWPVVAQAQQVVKVARIGWMSRGNATANDPNMNAFRQGMRELGYVEGQSFLLEPRYADGKIELMPDQAAELESVGPPTRGQGARGSPSMAESSAVLDAVQDASRLLHRCQMASWTASARDALPIGRSGRRNGRLRSNKRMKFTGSRSSAQSGNLGYRSSVALAPRTGHGANDRRRCARRARD